MASTPKLRDQLEQAAAARLVRLPLALVRTLGARRPVVIDGHRLDPRVQFALNLIQRAGRPPLYELEVTQARREYLALNRVFEGKPPPVPYVEDATVPGPAGELDVRLYRAGRQEPPPPALVFFHGGGGVIGGLDSHDVACRRLCLASRCMIVAVDYRLAPEHPFPQGLEDAIAAFRWVRDNAERLGADPGRIAVGGDSMGGCLATVTAAQCRGDDDGPPCFQLLIYPMTDAEGSTRSKRQFEDGYLLTREHIRWFHRNYMQGADPTDPRVSPLHNDNLKGMPPALVVTAGFDPLRDEGEAYADKLRQAGVAVTHHCYGELIHGFVQMTGAIEAAHVAVQDIGARLQRALQGTSRPISSATADR